MLYFYLVDPATLVLGECACVGVYSREQEPRAVAKQWDVQRIKVTLSRLHSHRKARHRDKTMESHRGRQASRMT